MKTNYNITTLRFDSTTIHSISRSCHTHKFFSPCCRLHFYIIIKLLNKKLTTKKLKNEKATVYSRDDHSNRIYFLQQGKDRNTTNKSTGRNCRSPRRWRNYSNC